RSGRGRSRAAQGGRWNRRRTPAQVRGGARTTSESPAGAELLYELEPRRALREPAKGAQARTPASVTPAARSARPFGAPIRSRAPSRSVWTGSRRRRLVFPAQSSLP